MGSVTQAHTFVTGETLTATVLNANPAAFVSAFANIDNTNIGPAGLFASQIIPTSVAQGTFGGTQFYTFPKGIIIPGGATNTGYQLSTAVGFGYSGGTGVPSHSAPNGTVWLRFDSATTPMYINTSGASTSGTTWTGVNIAQLAPYAAQAIGQVNYSLTGSETNASPGTIGSCSITLPSSSPGANGNWRVTVMAAVSWNSGTTPAAATSLGIGTSAAGSTGYAQFSNTSAAHRISGGNIVSDVLFGNGTGASGQGIGSVCLYSAVYSNGASATFNALIGVNTVNSGTLNGFIEARGMPN